MGVEIPSDFWEYLLPSAFKQKETPTVHTRPIVFDWKEALKPFMPAKMNNIMSYRSFRFVKEDGKVLLYYKQNSLSPLWLGEGGSPDEGIYIYLNYFKSKRY